MRKKEVQTIGEVLHEMLRSDRKLSKGLIHTRVVNNWGTIMGPVVSRSTKHLSLSPGGVLFVTLHSSVIRNELQMLKTRIIRNLNESVGETVITDIVFK